MYWTCDDMYIGKTTENRKVEIKVIPRPPGFETNALWYEYAMYVVDKLNKLELEGK